MNERQLKNYKKYTLVLLLITTGALVVCAAAFSFKRAAQAQSANTRAVTTGYYTPKQAASQETPAPQSAQPANEPATSPEFLVTIHNGKIGVFKSGESTPILLSDTEVYLLPQGDIDLLRKGIPAATLAEARSLLEDYE